MVGDNFVLNHFRLGVNAEKTKQVQSTFMSLQQKSASRIAYIIMDGTEAVIAALKSDIALCRD